MVVLYSPRLRSVLTHIWKTYDFEFVENLLDIEGWGTKFNGSFFDLSEKEGFVSFTNKDYDVNSKEDSDSLFSTESGPWKNSKSCVIKVGRLVRNLLEDYNVEVSDKDIEKFTYVFKSLSDVKLEFKLVSGKEIEDIYRNNHVGGSCMSGSPKRYFEIYSDNPDVCKLLVLYRGKIVVGRALIWKLHNVGESCRSDIKDKKRIMDNIYVSEEHLKEAFFIWMKSQGDVFHLAKNEKYDNKLSVKVKNKKYEKYPYFDTLIKYDYHNGLLFNYYDDCVPSIELKSTGGGYSAINTRFNAFKNRIIHFLFDRE